MIITNSRYALVGYFITSYPTQAHGIIVIYFQQTVGKVPCCYSTRKFICGTLLMVMLTHWYSVMESNLQMKGYHLSFVYVKEDDALQKINVYWLPYCFCYTCTFNRLKFWDCSLQFWERAFLTCKQPPKLAWLKEYYADFHRKRSCSRWINFTWLIDVPAPI